MKQHLRWLACLVVLALSSASSRPAFGAPSRGGASQRLKGPRGTATAAAQPFTLDISHLTAHLRTLPSQDVRDQLQDWALYGALHAQGLSGENLVKATHETAPLRLPYLEETFTFPQGPGRRAILDKKTAVLVFEKGTRDPAAVLGRLADQIRMETGQPPTTFRVFSFEADVPRGELHLERLPDVSGARLYSAAYGYSAAVIGSQAAFEGWLASVDDVTFARYEGGKLMLGGRRFPNSRTATVDVEDVAALFQASVALERERKALVRVLESRMEAWQRERHFRPPASIRRAPPGGAARGSMWSGRSAAEVLSKPLSLTEPLSSGRPSSQPYPPAPAADESEPTWESLLQKGEKVPPADPGFSLDPQVDQLRMSTALWRLSHEPCALIDEAAALEAKATVVPEDARSLEMWSIMGLANLKREIPEEYYPGVCRRLAEEYGSLLSSISQEVLEAKGKKQLGAAMVRFWRLKDELAEINKPIEYLLHYLLRHVSAISEFQCARYDGPLQGTRVGMNLFYTDLLAKLWIIDFNHSAPAMSIPGFLSGPRLPTTPLGENELKTHPYTRIWFGPKHGSFTFGGGDSTLLFRHVATRVYAAGSNPTNPGMEASPAEPNRRIIGWWDRHFAEVADYEQEFHRQNEIMKWSLLIGWLRSKGAPISFLADTEVRHDLTLDRWFAENQQQLRYHHPITLRPKWQWVEGRECLNRLSSYPYASGRLLQGGVSLGGAKTLKSAPRLAKADDVHLRYVKSLTHAGQEDSLDFIPRALPRLEGPGEVVVNAAKGTRTRAGAAELLLPEVWLTGTSKGSGQTALTLSNPPSSLGAEHALGTFSMRTEARKVRMAFSPGPVEQARAVLPKLEQAGSTARPGVHFREPIQLGDGKTLLVPLDDGQSFTRVVLNGADDSGALIKVPTSEADRALTAELIDASQSQLAIESYNWQYLTPKVGLKHPDAAGALLRHFRNEAPPAHSQEVLLAGLPGQNKPLRAVLLPDGGLAIARSELGGSAGWPGLSDFDALTPRVLQDISEKARFTLGKRVSVDVSQSTRVQQAVEAVHRGPTERLTAIEDVARTHPGGQQGAIDDIKAAALANGDRALEAGQPWEAARNFETARQLGEDSPELLLREALAEMEAGNSLKGLEHLQTAVNGLRGKPEAGPFMRRIVAILPDSHLGDVKAVLRADFGLDKALAKGRLSKGVQLEAHGTEVVSTSHLDGPLQARVLSPRERASMPGDKDVVIYIDDRFSMNRNDFETAPVDHLTELARSPHVQWHEVKEMPDESYSPSRVVAQLPSGEKAAFVKVNDIAFTAAFVSRRATRRVFIQNCDSNGDRVVTQAEQEQCRQPL